MTFTPHPIAWDRDTSQRFWDQYVSTRGTERFFSRQVGDAIIRHMRRHGVPLSGRVLDFGCGPGFLLEKLAARGVTCEGLDFSPDSVTAAIERTKAHAACTGVHAVSALPSALADASFDVALNIETIEHLLDEDLSPTFVEIHRLLKPGGTVVVTTPNDEDLAAASIMCPECGCEFHRMQHVRKWTRESLAAFMEAHGFRTQRVDTTTFSGTGETLAWLKRLLERARGRKPVNLVYIGSRTT